jgi:hypothetical protein
MYGNWLNGIEKEINARVQVGPYALLWSLLNCRNDINFKKGTTPHFLHPWLLIGSTSCLSCYQRRNERYGF